MKLIPNESWDIELFEITEILCILSMRLMWEGMKSQEFEWPHIRNFWKEILNEVFTLLRKYYNDIMVCVYNLRLALSFGHKLLSC